MIDINKTITNTNNKHSTQEEISCKILWSVEDVAAMTGFGEKKVREILKNPNSTFTIRKGNKLYAHRDLFQSHLEKCAKLGLTI